MSHSSRLNHFVFGVVVTMLVLIRVSMADAQTRTCSANPNAAAEAIRNRLASWVEAANARDASRMREIWAPGVEGWFPSAGVFSDSAAFAVAGLPRGRRSATSYTVNVASVDASDSFAAVHDLWVETKTFPDDSVKVQRVIRGSELWRCQPDGQWRIARYVSAPEPWTR